MADFGGTKLAILFGSQLLVYLRDDKPDIPFPAMWDFPGGGREGDETPRACALRETCEEFGIDLPEAAIVWERVYPSNRGGLPNWFMVARCEALVPDIRFGDEGQHWQMMDIESYLAHPQAIGYLKQRLKEYLAAQ